MWALAALICFVLALFHASVGSLDLVTLGFCFIALHLMWTIALPVGRVFHRGE